MLENPQIREPAVSKTQVGFLGVMKQAACELPQKERIEKAWHTLYRLLVELRDEKGYWRGRLSSSPLATATAMSALALFLKFRDHKGPEFDSQDIQKAIGKGITYLCSTQNPDGGWGDTDRSLSNIATTYLVRAALELSGYRARHADTIQKAEEYISKNGQLTGLRARYGRDQTFVAPILTNCALAGVVEWCEVPQLPLELAAFPRSLYRFLRMPVVSYAIPALVAVGLVRHRAGPGNSRLWRVIRDVVTQRCLSVMWNMQPASGGFLEAIPLTSFVVMSLCGAGEGDHPVVQAAIPFLRRTQREDGSWPVDVDLATWLTTLSVNALAVRVPRELPSLVAVDWILKCQWLEVHSFTGSAPGGWGWTDQPGAVPDADDTSGALLALAKLWPFLSEEQQSRSWPHVVLGLWWLLELQNRDGGWPTFCRGWGRLPFDQSAVDLTAHAVRAITAWLRRFPGQLFRQHPDADFWQNYPVARRRLVKALSHKGEVLRQRMAQAANRGIAYLKTNQKSAGFWIPLWFGNEFLPDEANPFYGTSRCLLALGELGEANLPCIWQALRWLINHQNADGSWGHGTWDRSTDTGSSGSAGMVQGSVEETALVVSALSHWADDHAVREAVGNGLRWLLERVDRGEITRATPIGLYFAKLWYYEQLYPIIFSLEALGRCLQSFENRAV